MFNGPVSFLSKVKQKSMPYHMATAATHFCDLSMYCYFKNQMPFHHNFGEYRPDDSFGGTIFFITTRLAKSFPSLGS